MKKTLKNTCVAFVILVIGFTSVSCRTASKSGSSKAISSEINSETASEEITKTKNWEEMINTLIGTVLKIEKIEQSEKTIYVYYENVTEFEKFFISAFVVSAPLNNPEVYFSDETREIDMLTFISKDKLLLVVMKTNNNYFGFQSHLNISDGVDVTEKIKIQAEYNQTFSTVDIGF